jgi:hypothetical protein
VIKSRAAVVDLSSGSLIRSRRLRSTDTEKQFDRLKLEVHHINRFLEREKPVNTHGKPGILSNTEEDGAHRVERSSAC